MPVVPAAYSTTVPPDEVAPRLRAADDRYRHPILHAAGRVRPLQLRKHSRRARRHDLAQLNQRRAADCRQHASRPDSARRAMVSATDRRPALTGGLNQTPAPDIVSYSMDCDTRVPLVQMPTRPILRRRPKGFRSGEFNWRWRPPPAPPRLHDARPRRPR